MRFLFLLFFFFFSIQWAYSDPTETQKGLSYERGGEGDSGPVQSVDFDELETCPNPNTNPPATSPVQSSNTPPTVINPMAPKEANKSQEVVNVSAEANKVLEVGYSCKVSTVETRSDDEGYKGAGYVQWTLVKKEGKKEIWSAHTQRWGPVYVGSVEDGYYNFNEAKQVCDRTEEFVFDGETHRIKMTVPEIGFGRGGSALDNPLNFELLKYLNYASVVSNEDRVWFWSGSLDDRSDDVNAWVFRPVGGLLGSVGHRNYHGSVRCVGR